MADLVIPEDVPWQLLCTSQDMMDPNFCNKKFPFPWRSSLAISAYEVPDAQLPVPFCNGRLTYIKLTLSITGYQPTDQEIEDAYVEFANTPVEADLDDVFAVYFGCYGALLNVAFFPNSDKSWQTKDFPRIIAMEPKLRELIQSATESGEILTATKDSLATTKSHQTTFSSKTGTESGVTLSVPLGTGTNAAKAESKQSSTNEWGSTQQDTSQVVANASDERTEKVGHTTQLEQLYNFLSAYHQGTNRGVFLMLPRPHILQPTDLRTFVQGIRSIEGVQEFFLAVVRPVDMEGICVEAELDTGHFPEDAEVLPPAPNYYETTETFRIAKHASNGGFGNGSGQTESLNYTHTVASGYVVDQRLIPSPPFPQGDSGHVGVSDHMVSQNGQGAPHDYNYQASSPHTVTVSGYIQGAGWYGDGAIFEHEYTVYCRSEDEIESDFQNLHRIADLLITSRNLCCCFYKKVDGDCLTIGPVPSKPPVPVPDTTYSQIVEQRELMISSSLLSDPIAGKTLEPATKGLLRQLKSIMSTSRDGRYSHTEDGISFLQSDFFISRILEVYPEEILKRLLRDVPGIAPEVVDAFKGTGTVQDALSLTLADFRIKTRLEQTKSLEQRQLLVDQIQKP